VAPLAKHPRDWRVSDDQMRLDAEGTSGPAAAVIASRARAIVGGARGLAGILGDLFTLSGCPLRG
jgi:hypothetical protein